MPHLPESTYSLFQECVSKFGFEKVKESLALHDGTLKRWNLLKSVPDNYYYDLNQLLGGKYDSKEEFRDKDQFFTKDSISKYCYDKAIEVINELKIPLKEYSFIEPSAGSCNFYNLMPKKKRIGIDIDPKGNKELVKKNYLDFIPGKGKFIVLGNPPFGLRGNLALRFINHSGKFADVVAFILPQLFNSDGKGSAKKRVEGYSLAHSEELPLNSFQYPDGKEVSVATVFQVWTKINTENIKLKKQSTCDTYIKIYSLSDGGKPSNTRNKKMLNACDVYLPSTCFSGMKAYRNFEDLPHRRGYGVVFLKDSKKLKKTAFSDIDWSKEAFLSTNSAVNLRTSLIALAFIKKGFTD